MIPLIILIGSFLLLLAVRGVYKELTLARAGRISFAVMLLFTGTSHFYLTEGMVMALPPFVPAREALVYLSGALEIVGAFAFVLASNTRLVARLLIAYLVLVFPANVYAALQGIDMENASYDGHGPAYLFFRAPLQLFFIAWVYYFGGRRPRTRYTHTMEWTVVQGRAGRIEVIKEEEKLTGRVPYWD